MEPAQSQPQSWSLFSRVLFRFSVIYFLLFVFPFHVVWGPIVNWAGEQLLNLDQPIAVAPSGSGDQTYNYVLLLVTFGISLIGTLLWSVLDRKRSHYRVFSWWFLFAVRGFLAYMMAVYGVAKLTGGQFQTPDLFRLTQDVGDLSPMGLAWLFMGYSPAYMIFAGVAEILGAILLLFRRTTMLGAAFVAGVMTNVVMMNFCFDIPVKIHSSHYLAMAIGILLPNLKRLISFFVLDRPVERGSYVCPHPKPTGLIVEWLFCGMMLFLIVISSVVTAATMSLMTPADRPINGAYAVERFEVDGKPRPLLATKNDVWKEVFFVYPQTVQIRMMGGATHYQLATYDEAAATLTLKKSEADKSLSVLNYRFDEETLILEGEFKGKPILFWGTPIKAEDTELMGRGFRWINEYPHNR